MRLKEVEIQNFRSIKKTTLLLLDLGITTLIGSNGSGKSNLLKAIIALKGDNTTPSDMDFHAKDPSGDGDTISIKALFVFEDRDKTILESLKITEPIEGFFVTVEKRFGANPTIGYEPVGFDDKTSEVIEKSKKEIERLVKGLTVDEPNEALKQAFLDLLNQDIDFTEDTEAKIASVVSSFDPLKEVSPEVSTKVNSAIENINGSVASSVEDKLGKAFNKISVELLQLNSYTIENSAPIAELQDRKQHPFLYDLLLLAGKTANDFNVTGTILSRIKRHASGGLSTSVSNIWTSHDLKFEIDRQGESLEFMVFTPQDHQVSLTDLSDGEQWFLKFYVRLAIAQKENKQIIWLFDEPGRDLHTSSQMDLKGFFETISEDAQVIYTSHLAMMIPWHRLERIFAVENLPKEGTVVHKRFWKDARLESPLKEALSTFVGEELLGGKEHLIIEGVSDYFFLQGWVRYFQNQDTAPAWTQKYNLFRRIIVPVDGIEKIPLYCWFLGRQVKKKINWVVVVDSTGESESTARKMTDSGLGSWAQNIKSVGELAASKKSSIDEIEALFKKEEYIKAFEGFYAEMYPKCVLPTAEEILEKNKTTTKITKVIEELLVEKNPDVKIDGNSPIALDKTGIAQYVYKSLLEGDGVKFSKETETRFSKLFENIEKTFTTDISE